MKATAFLVIVACALCGCTDDSPSADNAGAFTGRLDVSSKAVGQPSAAPIASAPVTSNRAAPRAFAVAGGVAEGVQSAHFSGAPVDETTSATNSAADALQNVNATTTSAPSMLIRVGQAFIEVEKVDPAILRIRQLAAQVGGYIANSSVSGGRDQIRQATLEVKIPASKYDQAVGDLSTIGKVETVNSTAEDVGEEFVDVTARVNNARRLEERLITLLSTRTGKLDEVLRVERELARVREEIERYEGRLRFLGARVATSTLTITVHEPAPILGNHPGQNPIAAALRRAWRNFVALIAGLIASLGVVIPLALIGLGGWLGYRRWKRREASQR
jgi:predicted negative regulator of RcsB-dependent stress response